jgi:hypothetical protein
LSSTTIAKSSIDSSLCVVTPLPAVEVNRENMTSVAIAILAGRHLGLRKAPTEAEIKEEFGGQFLAIYRMLESERSLFSTLEWMQKRGELALKAMEVESQAKLIEQEQPVAA